MDWWLYLITFTIYSDHLITVLVFKWLKSDQKSNGLIFNAIEILNIVAQFIDICVFLFPILRVSWNLDNCVVQILNGIWIQDLNVAAFTSHTTCTTIQIQNIEASKLRMLVFWASSIQMIAVHHLSSSLLLYISELHTKFVVFFGQLLGAARTGKLVETLFWAVFNLFCSF